MPEPFEQEPWIESFLKYMATEKTCSDFTSKAYKTDLQQFELFLNPQEIPLSQVTEQHARSFLRFLNENDYQTRSIARKIGTLKSFYKYLFRNRVVLENPWQEVKIPQKKLSTPLHLEEAQIQQLLDHLENPQTFDELRDRVILELLYSAGMRMGELINLQLCDIDLQEKTVRLSGRKNKERFSIIGPKAEESLRRYLEQRSNQFPAPDATEDPKAPLFISRYGKKISEQTIRKMLKQYLTAVGLDFHYTPHSIRNSFANHLLKHGAHPRIVQELMGHARLSTTQVHQEKREEKLRSVYERAHPLAQWNPPLPFKE